MAHPTTEKRSKPAIRGQNHSPASWIFGSLLLLFFVAVFTFAPDTLPTYKQRMLAIASALLAGLLAFFLTGAVGLKIDSIKSRFGAVGVKASGGIAVFVLVLVWWLSPMAPVSVEEAIYHVRVTVLGPDQMPVEGTEVVSSIGGEPKKVAGGWQFDIPAASKPADGKLIIYAAKKTAFLAAQRGVQLGEDHNVAVTVQLTKDTSASVRGMVVDDSDHAIPGARVSVVGYEEETITTQADGNFVLPAHAAIGQEVRLHVEKKGYLPIDQYHPAGKKAATIVLERK
ncbi:carboxypeptidase-like regulatory domain-containing protein [Acidobacteria bacterium AH-259-A15]|nr:carboxypeptidase-like regulatory domain-containing protein [Acidobacteria bacterium AH-259-A15]